MLRRSSIYIFIALVVLLLALGYYLIGTPNGSGSKVAQKVPSKPDQGQAAGTVSLPPATSLPASKVDAVHQQLADQLNAPDSTPQRDAEIIREFFTIFNKAYRNGNPVGLNEDITAALTGTANPQGMGQLFPRNSPAIRNGQLVDRWGTPYWFHPESATKMEIRSAGPDKEMFTPDDIISTH